MVVPMYQRAHHKVTHLKLINHNNKTSDEKCVFVCVGVCKKEMCDNSLCSSSA